MGRFPPSFLRSENLFIFSLIYIESSVKGREGANKIPFFIQKRIHESIFSIFALIEFVGASCSYSNEGDQVSRFLLSTQAAPIKNPLKLFAKTTMSTFSLSVFFHEVKYHYSDLVFD